MATETTRAKSPKPLMIRGDRLLLFMEVVRSIATVPGFRYEGGIRASRTVILRVLRKRYGWTGNLSAIVMGRSDPFPSHYRMNDIATILYSFQCFFASNEKILSDREIDLSFIRAFLLAKSKRRHAQETSRRILDQIFQAIASGELTEADFKE